MKKYLTLLLSAAAIVSLSACQKQAIPEGKYSETEFAGKASSDKDYIALKNLLIHIRPGESQQIDIETFPASYALSELEFVSLDSSIASVDANGIVTGVKNGMADVQVNSKDGSFSKRIRKS